MQTYQVNILNPKAGKLLQNLADMELISITLQEDTGFEAVVRRLRKQAEQHTPPTMEEITREVEAVRSERYVKGKG